MRFLDLSPSAALDPRAFLAPILLALLLALGFVALGCGPSTQPSVAPVRSDVGIGSNAPRTTRSPALPPAPFDISNNRDAPGAPGPLANEGDLSGLGGPL